jgi:hypothetical protein
MNRPSVALAGMPSITLTDWAQVRIETISFFVVVLLVLTLVVNGRLRDGQKANNWKAG